MIRESVSSSNIRSVCYDAKSQTLDIEFRSGGVYRYSNVPEAVYTGLITASSQGNYFHRNIENSYH